MAITLDGTNGVTTPDLTVDTTTLTVDTANDHVGIGTASPTLDGSLAGLSVNSGGSVLHVNNGNGATLKLTDPATGANRGLGITLQGTSAAISNCESGELRFGTGNAERMRIDASGRVTKPSNPSFSARGQDANWRNVPGGIGWSTIAGTSYSNTSGNYQQGTNFTTSGHYGAENIGNHFTNASGHFTAPIAGHYYFMIRMYLNRNNTNSPGIYLNPRINSLITDGGGAGIQGSYILERTTMSNSNNAYIPFGRHDVYYLNANDTFTYGLQAEAAGFQIYGQYTEFKGYLIG